MLPVATNICQLSLQARKCARGSYSHNKLAVPFSHIHIITHPSEPPRCSQGKLILHTSRIISTFISQRSLIITAINFWELWWSIHWPSLTPLVLADFYRLHDPGSEHLDFSCSVWPMGPSIGNKKTGRERSGISSLCSLLQWKTLAVTAFSPVHSFFTVQTLSRSW